MPDEPNSHASVSRDFRCPLCGMQYATRKFRGLHIDAKHNELIRFQCSLCGFGGYSNPDVTRHIRCHTAAGEASATVTTLEEEVVSESVAPWRPCVTLLDPSPATSGFDKETREKTTEAVVSGVTVRQVTEGVQLPPGSDIREETGSSTATSSDSHSPAERCPRCKRNVLLPSRSSNAKIRVVHCSTCGYHKYSMPDVPTSHASACADEHKETILRCPLCGVPYATRSNLALHIDIKHNRLIRFQCSVCGFGAFSTGEVMRHIRQHTTPAADSATVTTLEEEGVSESPTPWKPCVTLLEASTVISRFDEGTHEKIPEAVVSGATKRSRPVWLSDIDCLPSSTSTTHPVPRMVETGHAKRRSTAAVSTNTASGHSRSRGATESSGIARSSNIDRVTCTSTSSSASSVPLFVMDKTGHLTGVGVNKGIKSSSIAGLSNVDRVPSSIYSAPSMVLEETGHAKHRSTTVSSCEEGEQSQPWFFQTDINNPYADVGAQETVVSESIQANTAVSVNEDVSDFQLAENASEYDETIPYNTETTVPVYYDALRGSNEHLQPVGREHEYVVTNSHQTRATIMRSTNVDPLQDVIDEYCAVGNSQQYLRPSEGFNEYLPADLDDVDTSALVDLGYDPILASFQPSEDVSEYLNMDLDVIDTSAPVHVEHDPIVAVENGNRELVDLPQIVQASAAPSAGNMGSITWCRLTLNILPNHEPIFQVARPTRE